MVQLILKYIAENFKTAFTVRFKESWGGAVLGYIGSLYWYIADDIVGITLIGSVFKLFMTILTVAASTLTTLYVKDKWRDHKLNKKTKTNATDKEEKDQTTRA